MIWSRVIRGRTLCLMILLLSTLPALAELPFAEHGWKKEEAAAHLLSRLTFGARPGEVDKVAGMGLETWLNEQLNGTLPDPDLDRRLAELPPAYGLDSVALLELYPPPPEIRKMAKEAGLEDANGRPDRKAMQALLREKGLRPYPEIGLTLFAQKLLHARHSENEVREVLTDFWYNHFNVALSNNRAAPFILSYERDAIRPNALGKFRTLLEATAKHPAMLLYLDNANSTAGKDVTSMAEVRMEESNMNPERKEKAMERLAKRKKGLNENYARELMELHTLGVDGGYTQDDVINVARAFTGWTVYGRKAKNLKTEGYFRFAPPLHDASPKKLLGYSFGAGGGMDEGEKVLDILAAHPSTARHIAHKLAVRFICDNPSEKDEQQIAQAFQSSGGDIPATMRALVTTDGFWDKKNRFAKVKSPFELLVSANRALGGELSPSRPLYGWLAKMGQPLYNYQAPTGFPDSADFWVSSATVLNRVNFALYAARGLVPGFLYEPTSHVDVKAAVKEVMPYSETSKVAKGVKSMLAQAKGLTLEPVTKFEVRPNLGGAPGAGPPARMKLQPDQQESATLLGLILGTPEFQRR